MKKFFLVKPIFSVIMFALLLIVGCNKEGAELLEPNAAIVERGGEDSMTDVPKAKKSLADLSGCYNEVVGTIDAPRFEEVYGFANEILITYKDKSGRTTQLIPLLIEGEIRNLFIQNEQGDFYILEETSQLSTVDVVGTGISRFVSNLFSVKQYLADTPDYSMVDGFLGGSYLVNGQGMELSLVEKQSISGPDSGVLSGKLSDLCEDAIDIMLPFYAIMFNLPPGYETELFDAIAASHPSSEYCVCPIPNLVLENLIPTISDPDVRQDLIEYYFTISIVIYQPGATAIQTGLDLSCFEDCSGTGTQSVTICVDQPNPGTTDPYSYGDNSGSSGSSKGKSNVDVGHTFLVLEQNINGNTHIAVLGFYPDNGVSPTSPEVAGIFHDDSDHHYDVSVTYSLSCSDFEDLISFINLQLFTVPNYNLNSYNCTDFGISSLNDLGLNVPDTFGSWPLGGGSNPGALGEDLRNITLDPTMSRDDNGGTAPTQNCF